MRCFIVTTSLTDRISAQVKYNTLHTVGSVEATSPPDYKGFSRRNFPVNFFVYALATTGLGRQTENKYLPQLFPHLGVMVFLSCVEVAVHERRLKPYAS